MISKSRFYNTFDYFGNKRKVRNWTVIRKLLIVYGGFFKKRRNNRLFEKWVEMTRAQRQVDNIRDCGDNDRSTFFQGQGGDRIRIRLLIRTIE